jgi:hypothetical protein
LKPRAETTLLEVEIRIAAATVMPALVREKRKLWAVTGSAALKADTDNATYRVAFEEIREALF